jgi:hypothetical protein
MKRSWQVTRQFVSRTAAASRGDRAFQLLLEWTTPLSTEVSAESRTLCPCLDDASGAGSNDRSTTGTLAATASGTGLEAGGNQHLSG